MTTKALYMEIYRVLKKLGLLSRSDPDSKRNELHPHCFRKYFFSKLIGAGVDRGVAEHFMGHNFGLDNAYLHQSEEELRKECSKAVDSFTFLTEPKVDKDSKETIRQLQEEMRAVRIKMDMLERANKAKESTKQTIKTLAEKR